MPVSLMLAHPHEALRKSPSQGSREPALAKHLSVGKAALANAQPSGGRRPWPPPSTESASPSFPVTGPPRHPPADLARDVLELWSPERL